MLMEMLKIEIIQMYSTMFSRGTHKLFDSDDRDNVLILEIMDMKVHDLDLLPNHV